VLGFEILRAWLVFASYVQISARIVNRKEEAERGKRKVIPDHSRFFRPRQCSLPVFGGHDDLSFSVPVEVRQNRRANRSAQIPRSTKSRSGPGLFQRVKPAIARSTQRFGFAVASRSAVIKSLTGAFRKRPADLAEWFASPVVFVGHMGHFSARGSDP